MSKKNYKKTLALAAAAISVFEVGTVSSNLFENTPVMAAERQVAMSKVTIISQGTEVAKDLTATIKDSKGTTSAAVTVVLNEEIFVDNIIDSYDEEKKGLAINAALEHHDTINANLKINGFEINKDIDLLEGNTPSSSSWLVDFGSEPGWETDNIIYIKLRTKELRFNENGIEYIIPGFEYKTVIDVSPKNTGNNHLKIQVIIQVIQVLF